MNFADLRNGVSIDNVAEECAFKISTTRYSEDNGHIYHAA